MSRYRGMGVCMKCGGSRLKMSARQVFVHNKNIPALVDMPLLELYRWLTNLWLSDYEMQATDLLMAELIARTRMLVDIGLDYLTLSRSCQTLSGGEYQRINLSTALGSTLVGTLYVLDEPSVGMHARDTQRLLNILYRLRNLGNTIVVVEHDPDIIKQADFIIDMGLGAGNDGGNIVCSGSYDDLLKSNESLTAQYFRNEKVIEIPKHRRKQNPKHRIVIEGASENNLRIDKLSIPLNNLVVVTGVSGSGKSSLIYNVLYGGAMEHFGRLNKDIILGKCKSISGLDDVVGMEMVDQTPIGRSSRSTPATSIKLFDHIRDLFADQQASKQLGLKPGYFSFNVPGG
jgi:excinuclease ABC subunit A